MRTFLLFFNIAYFCYKDFFCICTDCQIPVIKKYINSFWKSYFSIKVFLHFFLVLFFFLLSRFVCLLLNQFCNCIWVNTQHDIIDTTQKMESANQVWIPNCSFCPNALHKGMDPSFLLLYPVTKYLDKVSLDFHCDW